MIKVKITARTFSHGSIMFGNGGDYEVDETTARYIVSNKLGVVTEGELENSPEPATTTLTNEEFLNFVKDNVPEIMNIFREFDAQRYDESQNTSLGEKEFQKSEPIEAIGTDTNPLTDDEQSPLSNSESEGTMVISDSDSDLPEDFPGRDILIAGGISKLSEVPNDKDSLLAISGVTSRLANQIGIKLSQV